MKWMKHRLWAKIFLQVAAIFAVFVSIIAIANSSFLYQFFLHQQKSEMVEQMQRLSALELDDTETVTETISQIADRYHFDVEIYSASGRTLFTTYGNQILDYLYYGDKLHMNHNPLEVISSETLGGGTLQIAENRRDHTRFIVYTKQLASGDYAELRLQNDLLKSSAETANQFVLIIASVCLVSALIWSFFFARRFSRPITQMRDITKQMSELNFSRRLNLRGQDEIAELAESINDMSGKLDQTLQSLEESNRKLRGEIEAERQLDAMRREFVANVSHELKTPISIIQGYAEGLKLNINEAQRDAYCDTIMDESTRMNRLVLSLLQLSKYESGQIPLTREHFNLTEMVREFGPRIVGESAVLQIDLPDSLFVFADPSQIEQVLKSYLENAAAHVNPGGTITVSGTMVHETEVQVEVHNTGSHVDTESMPFIWQSFYRGDKSHKRDHTRFGLGLSIVSAIMKLHGKECGVYNTETGVCFWFTVEADLNPAVNALAEPNARNSAETPEISGSETTESAAPDNSDHPTLEI